MKQVVPLGQALLAGVSTAAMPLFDFLTSPASFRLAQERAAQASATMPLIPKALITVVNHDLASVLATRPDFGHLTLLVFEAVLEVVCVSFPGYMVARMGLFDAESQIFLSNLNVQLFTPCLIFTKLASQLTADKLSELAIIPIIFVVQTAISYACAWTISKCFRFKKRQKNFVIAMGVFGNSNSLPISLVLSLSKTLKGLHWHRIPGDNDNEVGARGILYLLIFQQLGQLVRWTWGYNVLLAPAEKFSEEEGGTLETAAAERGNNAYSDDPDVETSPLLASGEHDRYGSLRPSSEIGETEEGTRRGKSSNAPYDRYSAGSSSTSSLNGPTKVPNSPEIRSPSADSAKAAQKKWQLPNQYNQDASALEKLQYKLSSTSYRIRSSLSTSAKKAFQALPRPVRSILSVTGRLVGRFLAGLWEFMNPPLWAMLVAVIVASIPRLQHLFFDSGTFVRNSVTRAVEQSGGVAVPLILVVLGGNLARNTLPKASSGEISDPKEERKLLIASLISRMVMPTLIMAPLLAVTAKYVQVSILDDKIFIIVCFLLTGAPTALQLAQICQINNVYMPVMSNILFQSYVIWILPSTLILVMLALETVAWAQT